MFGNPERGITAGETSGALDQDKRVKGVRVPSVLLQECSPTLRLEGRKREIAIGITRDNELHRRRTEMTDAIKENNGVVGLHASDRPSSHTNALSGICETSYVSPSKPSYLSTALSFTKICTKPDCWRTSTHHRAGPSPGTSIVKPITTDTPPSPPSPPMCAGSPSPTTVSSASRTVRSPSPPGKWAVRAPAPPPSTPWSFSAGSSSMSYPLASCKSATSAFCTPALPCLPTPSGR